LRFVFAVGVAERFHSLCLRVCFYTTVMSRFPLPPSMKQKMYVYFEMSNLTT
jgi:hypothetical protein